MSTRWPQGQQDQRSPYATDDEAWPQENGGAQPWQDDGWQAPDQPGYADQWAQAQGPARPGGPAVAEPSRGAAASQYQREWDQSGGGFGDDEDYEWFHYLSGGRSAEPKPDAVPSPRPGRDSARRGGGRPERPRSRRGKGRPARDDPGHGEPTDTDPGYGRSSATTGQNAATDPGFGRAAAGPAGADPGHGRGTVAGSRQGRPATTEPGYGQAPVAGWAAATDPGYEWPGATGQAPVPGWPAADAGYGQAATASPPAADPGYDQALPGWPAADAGYDQGPVAGWPAADAGYDQARVAGWPAADAGYDHAAVAGWTADTDPRVDQGPVAGWPAADAEYGQTPVADWATDTDADSGRGWPATADPRNDQAPVSWAATDQGYGWPATDDSGYAQPVEPGWSGAADMATPADTALGLAAAGPPAAGNGGMGPARQRRGARPAEADRPRRRATLEQAPRRQHGSVQSPARDDDTEPPGAEAVATRAPARQRPDRKPAKRRPVKPAPRKKPAKARAAGEVPAPDGPRLLAPPAPGEQPARQKSRPRSTRKTRGRVPMRVLALAGASAVVAGAAVVVLTRSGGGVTHVVTTPATLGAYSEQPQLAEQMHAATLRQQILTQSAGEANNVVYAVYEDSSGPAAASGPQIILFIGGNLSGTSAGSFISTFTGKLQGAVTTSAGSLGGAAACVPSVDGRVAECVWADNDTFGVVASQTLSTSALASEMRQMRPMVEHPASGRD
jgi:hypothetical protein